MLRRLVDIDKWASELVVHRVPLTVGCNQPTRERSFPKEIAD